MIQYTSSDIIKRAEQLADIENSDFISFNEKIALLNEAYTSLYQKLIDNGDSTFVRILNTQNSINPLPNDFWQLKCVTLNNNGMLVPILRRPQNQSLLSLSYEIINNVLQINGNTGGATINIEYWVVPESLTFPNVTVDLPTYDYTSMKSSIYTYITVKDNETFCNVGNLNDVDFSFKFDITGLGSEYYIHQEETGVIAYNNLMGIYLDFTTMNTYNKTFNNNLIPIILNHKIGLLNKTTLEIVTFTDRVVGLTEFNSDTILDSRFIIAKNLEFAVGIHKTNNYIIVSYLDDTIDLLAKKIECFDNVYVINDTGNLILLDFFGDYKEINSEKFIKDVIGINANTGYGYLTTYLGKSQIISYFEDTLLNFPNNLYFTFLGYLLAMSFKTKQGSDTTQLYNNLIACENTFYDTLKQDDWCSVRITNVY